MSKASTLARVIDDIARKDLGKARDRLLGLVRTYPNDLGLRHILGRIFLELQYPQEAGKHLYLVEDQSEAVQSAVRKFEKSCQNDPCGILKALRLRGHIDGLEPGYAKDKLLARLEECKDKWKNQISIDSLEHIEPTSPVIKYYKVWGIGCLVLIVIMLIVGLIRIGAWLFKWISGLLG